MGVRPTDSERGSDSPSPSDIDRSSWMDARASEGVRAFFVFVVELALEGGRPRPLPVDIGVEGVGGTAVAAVAIIGVKNNGAGRVVAGMVAGCAGVANADGIVNTGSGKSGRATRRLTWRRHQGQGKRLCMGSRRTSKVASRGQRHSVTRAAVCHRLECISTFQIHCGEYPQERIS